MEIKQILKEIPSFIFETATNPLVLSLELVFLFLVAHEYGILLAAIILLLLQPIALLLWKIIEKS